MSVKCKVTDIVIIWEFRLVLFRNAVCGIHPTDHYIDFESKLTDAEPCSDKVLNR